jgi:hypothetical protein
MELPLTTRFVDKSSGASVPGLIRIASDLDLVLWMRWRYRLNDTDRHWDWWGIHLECAASQDRFECYAALALDELQGLAVLDLKRKKIPSGGAITLDYLSTNPANRKRHSGLKHVGVALVAAAVVRSMESGAGGSIWLESLPDAAGFYENIGMTRQSRRSAEGNDIYILQPRMAEQLLEETKAKGIVVP